MKKIFVLLFVSVLVFSLAACRVTISPLPKEEPQPVHIEIGEEPAPAASAEPAPEPAPAPDQAPAPTGIVIKPGILEVGIDINAGEYVIVGSGSFVISTDSSNDFESFIGFANYVNRSIVTVRNGEYFTFDFGKMYPIDDAPPVDLSSGKLEAGMYLVGKDFKAGEYKLVPDENASEPGFVTISSDSRHDFNFITAEYFDTDRYQIVKDGEYIDFVDSILVL